MKVKAACSYIKLGNSLIEYSAGSTNTIN